MLHIAFLIFSSIFDVHLLGRSGNGDSRDRDLVLDLTTA